MENPHALELTAVEQRAPHANERLARLGLRVPVVVRHGRHDGDIVACAFKVCREFAQNDGRRHPVWRKDQCEHQDVSHGFEPHALKVSCPVSG